MEDAELMLAFQAGDESAFGRLIERYQVALVNHFHRLVFDRHIAEDLTQEVFLRVGQHRMAYAPVAKFATYLYRIARNCWIDHMRRTRLERDLVSLDAADEENLSFHERLAADVETPGETAHKGEFAEAVVQAVQDLPESHREVFVLGVVDGLKYHEIAEVLEIPVGTVKSRMHNALSKLRGRLTRVLHREAAARKDDEP